MSRLDFRRSQHLPSLSPVSRWQRDHEGSRRNAIGKFRWGHGLCAGDGGRLGDELAGAQISAHRATAAVDTKARYHRGTKRVEFGLQAEGVPRRLASDLTAFRSAAAHADWLRVFGDQVAWNSAPGHERQSST